MTANNGNGTMMCVPAMAMDLGEDHPPIEQDSTINVVLCGVNGENRLIGCAQGGRPAMKRRVKYVIDRSDHPEAGVGLDIISSS
jgi:hypothetical protein